MTESEDESNEEVLVVNPAGTLEVRQTVVDLDITLEKLGKAPLADHDRFTIRGFTAQCDDPDALDAFVKHSQGKALTLSLRVASTQAHRTGTLDR